MASDTFPISQRFSYASVSGSAEDGILRPLLPRLLSSLGANDALLDELPRAKKATLWFRQGAKRIFYISVVRKTGRCVVALGGLDSQEVLRAVRVCRDHFDHWFGITPEDLQNNGTRARRGDGPR